MRAIVGAAVLAMAAGLVGCRTVPVQEGPRNDASRASGYRGDASSADGAGGGISRREEKRERREARQGGGFGAGAAGGGAGGDTGFGPRGEGGGNRSSRRGGPAAGAAPGAFDFYLLNLSWSPEFCATHGSSPECGNHLGFVLHGLWPQNQDGSYPEHCSNEPGPASLGPLYGIVPTVSLLEHEWTTHGTCTGLNPAAWESAQKTAFTEVRIPAGFGSADGMLTPDAIVGQFAAVNPGFPAGSIVVSCGNNRLTAIEVCMTKDLRPEACSGVKSCRANVVKITGK